LTTSTPRGDQEGLIYPSTLDISFLPNAYGEPRQAGAFASSVTRHPNGAIASLSYGNGLIQSTTQNLRQLPLRRSVGTQMDQTHTYDENANIQTLTDATSGSAETRTLAYDGLDRMVQADAPNQLGNERYRFDALDNLRQATMGSDTFVHTLNSQNRLSQIQKNGANYFSYTHNAQGDTTARTGSATSPENIFANGFENPLSAPKFAQNQALNYDRAHRLMSISNLESYQYDAHGRRVKTTAANGQTRYQLYSFTGVLMHSEDQRSNEVIDYINLEGQLVAERSKPINGSTVTTRYQHADLRMSPTIVTSTAGTQVERSIEQPFGAPYDGIYRDGPGFTGHATDAASGLSYMQQRYYDPIAMRFLSVDPAQSEFSRYSYGANNPYKFVDPDGRAAVVAVGPMIEGCAANPLCRGAAQHAGRAIAQQAGKVVEATVGDAMQAAITDYINAQSEAQAALLHAQMQSGENEQEDQEVKADADKTQNEPPSEGQSDKPAPEKMAIDIGRRVERDLGRSARREFHDSKQRGDPDRTASQLREDARALYEDAGKEIPKWLEK
jgi:RHS repeat-associated protein